MIATSDGFRKGLNPSYVLLRGAYASGMVSTRRQGRHWKACTAGRFKMAGSVAKNVIGRPHFEQIRTGGLSFAAQIIARMPGGVGHNRRMLRGVHLGATTGFYRNLADFCNNGIARNAPTTDHGSRWRRSHRVMGFARELNPSNVLIIGSANLIDQ